MSVNTLGHLALRVWKNKCYSANFPLFSFFNSENVYIYQELTCFENVMLLDWFVMVFMCQLIVFDTNYLSRYDALCSRGHQKHEFHQKRLIVHFQRVVNSQFRERKFLYFELHTFPDPFFGSMHSAVRLGSPKKKIRYQAVHWKGLKKPVFSQELTCFDSVMLLNWFIMGFMYLLI